MTQVNDEDVPPASPELLAFLKEHDEVGTPTPGELRRGRERLLDAVTQAQKVTPLRRRWLPPEVLAVAAVLFVAIVAQLIYVTVKRGEAADQQTEAKALQDAWGSGNTADLKQVVERCSTPSCSDTGGKMLAALSLSSRIDTLGANELRGLAQIDAELSKSGSSPIAERIAQRRQQLAQAPVVPRAPIATVAPVAPVAPAPRDEPQQYYEAARELKNQKKFEDARTRLQACTSLFPEFPPCWRLLGSVEASISSRDESKAAQLRAITAYRQYLAVADADDEYVPRVREILGMRVEEPAPKFDQSKALKVSVKQGKTMHIDTERPLQRIAIGSPDIIEVNPVGGNRLKVKGLKKGTCHLVAWYPNGERGMWIVDVN